MGSLLAAVASYLEARVRDGEWLVRIEDLDPPREVAGSAAGILRTLERFGFEWDGSVIYQSTRSEAYSEALETLRARGLAYPCACSRSEIAMKAITHGAEGPIYPGTCRNGLPPGREGRAIRLRTDMAAPICFLDRLRGETCQDVARDVGDFVIRRADGHFAYQLAVVVDDAWQGITDVVRGSDLLLSTPRQIWLQRQLLLPTPGYLHIPLLLDEEGRKLSKQSGSAPVDADRPSAGLVCALRLLRLAPPAALEQAELSEIWSWARENWQTRTLRQISDLTCVTD